MLIAGWHDFDSNSAAESPDYAAFGYSGKVIKTFSSVTNLGSNDGFYGNSAIASSSGANGYLVRFGSHSATVFELTNVANNNPATMIKTLYFDAARSGGGGTVSVAYQIGAGPIVNLGTTTSLPAASNPNYGDYAFNLIGAGVHLGLGQTIKFLFTSSLDAHIDNVAIVAIPEPASLLVLGGVLSSGLLLRSRRPSRASLPGRIATA